jgi:HEPN domain-containing protein
MSSAPREVEELVRKWLEKADHDLVTAEHTLTLGDACPFDTVCFHAQQSVEKCMKAVLVRRQIPFGKTHDLEELALLVPAEFVPPLETADLARLTPHATNTRYPDEWAPIAREEAEWAVRAARELRAAVEMYLGRL